MSGEVSPIGPKRILVTGGAGFIGSNLVRYLLDTDASLVERVVTLDNLTYAGNRANLSGNDTRHQFVEGDILDLDLVRTLLKEEEISAVLHLAAETHVDRSIDDSAKFVETNVEGTRRLLEAARLWYRDSENEEFRFLYVSTDEVYGSLNPDDEPSRECDPFAPNSPYSASKAAGDHLVRAWHRTYGLPVLTVRPSNTYGPRQFPEKLIPLMLSKLRNEDTLPVYGDGSHVRDWLYVDDLCEAIYAVLDRAMPGGVFNVGGGNERTNQEVVRALIRITSCDDVERKADPIQFVEDRPGHDSRYSLDTGLIQNMLGWDPEVDVEEGLLRTVQWYNENRDWSDAIASEKYRGQRLGLNEPE